MTNHPHPVGQPTEEVDSMTFERKMFIMMNHATTLTDLSPLWRVSQGSRSKAYNILVAQGAGYGVEMDDELFNHVCAELSDGCEVEWATN